MAGPRRSSRSTTVQQPIPIWIGGNAGRTRQRVAERAQGWMPMPNPAAFAKTTRSPVLDGPDDLAHFIADLHRRADEAGRDDPIDIVFVVPDGGRPDPPASRRTFIVGRSTSARRSA